MVVIAAVAVGVCILSMTQMDAETQDIVRILEGKMIGWDVERIREHLVRVED